MTGGVPETLYAGRGLAGLLRGGDGGRSWVPAASGVDMGGAFALAVDPASRQTVYAGGGGGRLKTGDGGVTWTTLPYPGNGAVVLAIGPWVLQRVPVIAAAKGQGLACRSDDDGQRRGMRR